MKSRDLKDFDQHRAKLPRTDFDMAQIFTFTSSTGMILPVYQDFLNAGDSVHFAGNLFSRTQPLVTAAMVDVDFYEDWFFVPASMLYTAFTNLRFMTNDYISSYYANVNASTQLDGSFPLLDVNDCLTNTAQSGSESGYNNFYFDCFGKARFRLSNHLGFNPYGIFDGDATYDLNNLPNVDNPNVFPMFALAYQAIFQKYFRLDEWDSLHIPCYNWDALFAASGTVVSNPTFDPFILRYRPYHRDYFKQVFSSPLLNSVNLQGRGSGSASTVYGTNPVSVLERVKNYLVDSSHYASGSSGTVVNIAPNDNNFGLTDVHSANGSGVFSYVTSVANLRNMFAVDKLLRITNKAKKDYDSQMLAHFGVKIPHDVKHDLTHLGTDKAVLHIGEVVSTSDTFDGTNGSALGSLSGKGYVSIRGKKRKFTAPVDGVFMCVVSAVPRLSYYNTFDKINSFTSRLDLYTPEFDRLGAQPLFGYETNMSYVGNSSRAGWQYRYSQWKLKYDKCTEAFRIPRPGTSVINQYSAWINSYSYFTGHTDPSLDGTQLFDAFGPGTFYNYFYCSPHALDQIMVVQYQSVWNAAYSQTPWLMFDTDPFINQFSADVTKVSVMSHTGEPLMD